MQERSGLSYTDPGQGQEENGPAILLSPQQRHHVSTHHWQDAYVLQEVLQIHEAQSKAKPVCKLTLIVYLECLAVSKSAST